MIQQDEYKAALQSARAQLAKADADLTRARDASVIDRARAPLDQAKADLGRIARTWPATVRSSEQQAIPQQDLDTAVSHEQVAAAAVRGRRSRAQGHGAESAHGHPARRGRRRSRRKAAVIQADLNLKYTVIESPITGIISKLDVDTGNLVGKGEPTLLATVSAVHPMFVDFSIAEVDYLRLVKRMPGLGRGETCRGTGSRRSS